MRSIFSAAVALTLLGIGPAKAQFGQYFSQGGGFPQFQQFAPQPSGVNSNPSNAFVSVIQQNGLSQSFNTYLPLSSFAPAGDVARMVSDTNKRSAELSSLAAAFTIIPPNPGDRFSLSISGAVNDTTGAASISGAYRMTDSVLIFGGYARSETQNMAKGGAAFSFR
jgi:hypothetical protein